MNTISKDICLAVAQFWYSFNTQSVICNDIPSLSGHTRNFFCVTDVISINKRLYDHLDL